jgi:hypothetical protein
MYVADLLILKINFPYLCNFFFKEKWWYICVQMVVFTTEELAFLVFNLVCVLEETLGGT